MASTEHSPLQMPTEGASQEFRHTILKILGWKWGLRLYGFKWLRPSVWIKITCFYTVMEQTEHVLFTIYILWFYHVPNSWQNCLAFVETVRAHVCLLGSPPPKAVLCWKCILSIWEKHHHLLEGFIWGCYCYVSQRPLGFNVSGWGHLECL